MKMSIILFFVILITLISCNDNTDDESDKKTCKELNCLMGDCIEQKDGAICICSENATLTEARICSLNTCQEQNDCSIFQNKICGVDNKCISDCKNDNDCIGENELCLVDKNKCVNIAVLYQENSCITGQYLDYITSNIK